jgi:serine/threonine-protein kinase HipA
MPKFLDVYLHNDLVGTLIQDDGGQMLFTYHQDWLKNPSAKPLSHSLPLRTEQFSQKVCQGFFGGLLPEEKNREVIAKNLGISKENDFSMLREIGGECAGAVTFMPHEVPLSDKTFGSRIISDAELAAILRGLPQRPLMSGTGNLRLSLAGAQNKIAVRIEDDIISIPIENTPSTHIIKPDIPEYKGVVYNEGFCMKLAKTVGLTTADVHIGKAEDIDYLAIKRYDRKNAVATQFVGNKFLLFSQKSWEIRLHQEDFCQALGIPSKNKYQEEGGPSIRDCIDLIRKIFPISTTEIQKFLDAVIFNYLIGNTDAHGKNFSLVYNRPTSILDDDIYFAPLYDLICTVYYPNLSPNMAMKIGGESRHNLILPQHFEKMAEECSLSKPLLKKRVRELTEMILIALQNRIVEHEVADKVTEVIKFRCRETLESFNA